MNGVNVRYWEGRTPPPEYYAEPNPEMHILCPFNLRKVIDYSKKVGREITDLTRDEVEIISQI